VEKCDGCKEDWLMIMSMFDGSNEKERKNWCKSNKKVGWIKNRKKGKKRKKVKNVKKLKRNWSGEFVEKEKKKWK
jgi:hypothetical protein